MSSILRLLLEANELIEPFLPETSEKIRKTFGLNVVGLRRTKDLTDEDRRQIKEAFGLTYRSGLTPAQALEKMDACSDWGEGAGKFRDFIRWALTAEAPYNRGLCRLRKRGGKD